MKKIYNKTNQEWHVHSSNDNFWIKWRYDEILKALKLSNIDLNKNYNCLDVGSGMSNFAEKIERNSNFIVDQFDIDKKLFEKKVITKGKFYFYDINAKENRFKNKYDIIFLMDVLEHIEDDKTFFNNLEFYLKHDGKIIINVPSLQIFYSKYDIAVGHCRRYTRSSIKKLINQKKYDIKMYYWGLFLIPLLLLRKIINSFQDNHEKVISRGMSTKNKVVKKVLNILRFVEVTLPSKLRFVGSSLIVILKKKNV